MVSIEEAVRTGIVLFSTMILGPSATSAIIRAAASIYFRSAARPAPTPWVLVGVPTHTKMMSAALMAPFTSVEKKRFLPRAEATTLSSPGS